MHAAADRDGAHPLHRVDSIKMGIKHTTSSASSPAPDMMRGRTRDRSHARRASIQTTRARVDEHEASTLRGRSRHRATSPDRDPSTSSVLSPTRNLLIHNRNRLHQARREHCPSRAPSSARRRQRTPSKSRNTDADHDIPRLPEGLSSLRNEVHADDSDPADSDAHNT